MGARLVLPADCARDEWLEARKAGITASEVAALLGISPYESPFSLYWRKRGLLDGPPDSAAMSLGRHLEPWISDRWEETHPEYVVGDGGLWAAEQRPWQMATPDRLLRQPCCGGYPDYGPLCRDCGPLTGVLEIKSSGTYDGWGPDGGDEIPAHYRAQVLWQMDVMGVPEAHVACLFLSSRTIREYVIAYDVTDVDLMRREAHAFMDRIECDDPPPVDSHHATTEALRALYPDPDADEAEVGRDIAETYRRACADLTAAKTAKAGAENKLRAALGEHHRATDGGATVATRSRYVVAGIDRARLKRDHPDAYAACKTEIAVDKINPARKKA